MSSHSNVQSLAATLKQKQAEDRQQIEALTKNELNALARNLQQQSRDALNTTLSAIESDLNQRLAGIKKQIEAQTRPLSAALSSVKKEAETLQALTARAWLRPLLLSLSLLLGICFGSWGLMLYLSSSIQSKLEQREALAQEIQKQQRTLEQIQAKTWGVEFHQDSTGRFLILPPGVEPVTGWTFGQGKQSRQAVRLGKP